MTFCEFMAATYSDGANRWGREDSAGYLVFTTFLRTHEAEVVRARLGKFTERITISRLDVKSSAVEWQSVRVHVQIRDITPAEVEAINAVLAEVEMLKRV